jgi:hypothetical protein
MTGFLERIRSLVRGVDRQRATPFTSIRTTQKWLQNLPASSDYDAHHALVEGLERYNGDARGEVQGRIKVLRRVEEAGLPLQARLVAQYLKNHAASDSARRALWRECNLFWDQLTVAYLQFLKPALGGGEGVKPEPWGTEIAVKSLRYFSLCMRWGYFHGQHPGESAWRRLHKIYRMAEMAGVSHEEIEIEGRETSCVREYVMTLLFDLANPYAFGQADMQQVMELLDGLETLPTPEPALRHDRHSHMVDLSSSSGPERIEDRYVPGSRLRYLDLRSVSQGLEQRAMQVPPAQQLLCKKLAKVIGRSGASRSGPRRPRFGEVRAVFGAELVMKAFSPYLGVVPNTEFISLRDESREGIGFVLQEEHALAPASLLAIERDDGHGSWQLLAVRWLAAEGNEWLLGAEILSKYPKRVSIEWETDGSGRETGIALFLPLASVSHGAASNLLLPPAAYSSGRLLTLRQDDGTSYYLKLGEVVETHESWLRAGFDVLSREAARAGQ